MKTYSIKAVSTSIVANSAVSALIELQKIRDAVYANNTLLKLSDREILAIMYNNAFDVAARGAMGVARRPMSIEFKTENGKLILTSVFGRVTGTFNNYNTDQLTICGSLKSIQSAIETLLDADDHVECDDLKKLPAVTDDMVKE